MRGRGRDREDAWGAGDPPRGQGRRGREVYDEWDDEALGVAAARRLAHAPKAGRSQAPSRGRRAEWDDESERFPAPTQWEDEDPWPQDDGWGDDAYWEPGGRGATGRRGGLRELTGKLPGLRAASEQWDEWTSSLATADGRRQFFRKPRNVVLLVLLLTCVVLPLAGTAAAYPILSHVKSLATDGLAHIKNAETDFKAISHNPFDAATIAAARKELAAANSDFSQLNDAVARVPGVAGVVPKYGSLYSAGKHLAPVAMELTQAGMIGCDALTLIVTKLKNPLDSASKGLTADDAKTLQQDLTQVVSLANVAIGQLKQLPPEDLNADPRLGPAVGVFQQNLPTIQKTLESLHDVVPMLPALLGIGTPSTYLVEQLDSTEIRAGGGFIGTYGLATVDGGRLGSLHMQDVDLLDNCVKYGDCYIPIPDQYAWFKALFPRWGFRDSNLDADFPTSAQNAEKLYQIETNAKSDPFQGVIAITPWLFQDALKVTGPISVPGYDGQVTADNFIERIHYYQLVDTAGPDNVVDPTTGTSLRKRFTGALFAQFMEQVKAMAGTPKLGQIIHLFVDGLHTKDLQIYLNAPPAEHLLQQFHLGSTIEAPPTGDSLFIVDNNIVADKANNTMSYVLHDQVTLDDKGNAVHHATLTYTWPSNAYCAQQNWCYGSTPYYEEFLRLYVPPKATLQNQDGWYSGQGTEQAFGREVFYGRVLVPFGGSTTLTLTWTVPGAAVKDAAGWHYQYLLQRQAGISWSTAVEATLPACAQIKGNPSQMAFFGRHGMLLSPNLTGDTTLGVDYSC